MEEDITEFLGTDGGQIADEVTGLTAAATLPAMKAVAESSHGTGVGPG